VIKKINVTKNFNTGAIIMTPKATPSHLQFMLNA